MIVRERKSPDRRHLAKTLLRLTRPRRIKLLIASDWRLAFALRADGVHLPDGMAAILPALRRLNPAWLLTLAAHDPIGLHAAIRGEADLVLLAPFFATQSHPGATALGPVRWAAMRQHAKGPVAALGGMGATTVTRAIIAGADAIALITGWTNR